MKMFNFDDLSYDEIEKIIDDIVDSEEFDKISKNFFKSITLNNNNYQFQKQIITQLNKKYCYFRISNKIQLKSLNKNNLIIAA